MLPYFQHDRLIYVIISSKCMGNEINITLKNFFSYLLIHAFPLSLDLSFFTRVPSPAHRGTDSSEGKTINSGLINRLGCKSEGFHLRRCIQKKADKAQTLN